MAFVLMVFAFALISLLVCSCLFTDLVLMCLFVLLLLVVGVLLGFVCCDA